MGNSNVLFNRFNRGEVSPWALTRVDSEYLADSSETMTNWMPMRLGPMMLRPGTIHVGNAQTGYLVEFNAGQDDTAILEFYNNTLRIWDSDTLITRPTTIDTVVDGNFSNYNISTGYQWTQSTTDTDEYYIELSGGGDPGLAEPDSVFEPGEEFSKDVGGAGGLTRGQWAWDDNDTLGFTTVYVRTENTVDPDTLGYMALAYDDDWTDQDEGGSARSFWRAGKLVLIGDGTQAAIRRQEITINNTGIEHSLRLVVEDAPIDIKIGTSAGAFDIYEGELKPGTHSLTFEPAGNVFVDLGNAEKYEAVVDSCTFEAAGTFTLPTSVATASLQYMRYDQSADVVFFACRDVKPFQVERRAPKSWSIVDYQWQDGPFNLINTTPISMTPSDAAGNVSVTASKDYFNTEDHVGTLIRIDSNGQAVSSVLSAEATFTNYIRVAGVGNSRKFKVTLDWAAAPAGSTVTLQRSIGDPGAWEDADTDGIAGNPDDWTADTTNTTVDDGLDNQIIYYRLGIKSGDYTASDSITCSLNYENGSLTGIGRITSVASATVAAVAVIDDFGGTGASKDWYISEFSEGYGYPSAVALYEGRLWWGGKNKIWGSESDLYDSFDTEVEGDSKALRRTIGFGPVDDINWIYRGDRLVMGTAGNEISVRSTGFTEAITATNANLHEITTQGSDAVNIVKVDKKGFFVQQAGTRLFELASPADRVEHELRDTMLLHPEIGTAGIKKLGVQRQPETRLYAVLNDGTCIVMLQEPTEDLLSWYRITMAGTDTIEDVVILPNSSNEDDVYFTINRVNGRYLEKLAHTTVCRGASISKCLDSNVTYTSPGATAVGLSHLNGVSNVRVWADGRDRGAFPVVYGTVTLPESTYTDVVVGIGYTATYKSFKLAFSAQRGTALTMKKVVRSLGVILKDYHPGSLTHGPDLNTMTALPGIEDGEGVGSDTLSTYDETSFEFEGGYDTDSRLFLQATAPVTVLAAVLQVDTKDD